MWITHNGNVKFTHNFFGSAPWVDIFLAIRHAQTKNIYIRVNIEIQLILNCWLPVQSKMVFKKTLRMGETHRIRSIASFQDLRAKYQNTHL
jgi:hypothetical protein